MAATLKHLRSSIANNRPVASELADGQLAINTASGSPGLFFKDSNDNLIKVGPVHIGTTAPNATPAGSAGHSKGELWVDESTTTPGLKYYSGSSFVNLTPSGTTSVTGLVELATAVETQTGTDGQRAVTPSGLQSKISDSVSTTSSTTIASSTAVKTAYDLASTALSGAGGTITGQLLISPSGSLVFEGSVDDDFETTLAVENPTADRTITFPNVSGTIITTGDTGTVTSAIIADNTIVDADINSAAAIAHSKLASMASGQILLGNASGIPTSTTVTGDVTVNSTGVTAIALGVIVDADINNAAAISYSKLALSSGITNTDISASAAIAYSKLAALPSANILVGNASNVATATAVTGDISISNAGVTAISSGAIVNADVNNSAAIAGTKISPDFGSQNILTTGSAAAAFFAPTGSTVPTNGLYLPATNTLGFSTNSGVKLSIDASGNILKGPTSAATSFHIANTATTPIVQIAGNDTSASAFSVTHTTTSAGRLHLCRGSAGNNVVDGDNIGQIHFSGYDGNSYRNAAIIQALVDGTPSAGTSGGAGDMPGSLSFQTSADASANPTERLVIGSNGLITLTANAGLSLSKTGVTSPAATDGNVFSGTYTPTLTNTTNISSSTASQCHYMRVGNTVTVGGQVQFTVTTANTDSVLRVTLPIASAFTAARQLGGAGAAVNAGEYGESIAFLADATNDVAEIRSRPTVTTSQQYHFSFTYLIL